MEGRKVIMASLVSRLLKTSLSLISFSDGLIKVGDSGSSVMKYSVNSLFSDIFTIPLVKVTLPLSASLTTSVM